MPTVECEHTDCRRHGRDICIAKRVKWENGQCSEYDPDTERMMQSQRPNCVHRNGGYKSFSPRVFR